MLSIGMRRRGYLFFMLGVCIYSVSDAIMKYFAPLYGVHQVIFLRTVFRFLPIILFVLYRKINPLKSNRLKENIFRSILAAMGTYSFMYAYNYSTMVDVFTIGLTSSVFILPLSVWILKEKFRKENAFSVLLCFLGICLAMRPGKGIFRIGIVFAVIGAMIAAFNQVIIKRLSYTESEVTIIFYHHVSLILLSLGAGFSTFRNMNFNHASFLFCGGIIGAVAQYLIVHAIKISSISRLASAQYVVLVSDVLFDFFLYNRSPDKYIIGGLVLILAGTTLAFRAQSKACNAQ